LSLSNVANRFCSQRWNLSTSDSPPINRCGGEVEIKPDRS
jgi:hypothetical protein